MRGKRAQFFDLIIIIGAIAMILTAVTAVLSSRANLPQSSPNLQAKEIILAQQAFDVLEQYVEISFEQSVDSVNILQSMRLSAGENCFEERLFMNHSWLTYRSSCWQSYISEAVTTAIQMELDVEFSIKQSQLDSLESTFFGKIYAPASVLAIGAMPKNEKYQAYSQALWSHNFDASQMDIHIKNEVGAGSLLGIYRKPLEYSVTSGHWKVDARRDIFVKSRFSPDQQKIYDLLLIFGDIQTALNSELAVFYNEHQQQLSQKGSSDLTSVDILSRINLVFNNSVIHPKLVNAGPSSFNYWVTSNLSDGILLTFPNQGLAITAQIPGFILPTK